MGTPGQYRRTLHATHARGYGTRDDADGRHTVDFGTFKLSDWLKVGGGALMLVAGFLAWWKVEFQGLTGGSVNAFDYFFTGTIPWLLLVGIAVITLVAVSGSANLPSSFPLSQVTLATAAFAFLLVLIRFFSDGVDDNDLAGTGIEVSRGIGLYFALITAIIVLVGAVLGFHESGGNFGGIKDLSKLKDNLGRPRLRLAVRSRLRSERCARQRCLRSVHR